MASSVPGPIALPESRYDLSTFTGRVKHCAEISDPTMLLSTKEDIQKSKRLIWDYRNGVIPEMTPELWHAKKVLDSSVHPDTGETVFFPFRMSSCVLSNLVVTAGMLTPGLGNLGTAFWQIANQSLNVAINTSNANKSHPLSTKQLVTSYFLAVGSSCGVAIGLNSIIPRLKNVGPHTRLIMSRLVPFAAVVAAGIVNVFLMRGEEIRLGISVFDQDGNDLGSSKKAALQAVGETAASRVINAAPIMVIPPLILVRLQRGFLRGRGLGIQTVTNIGLIAVTSFAVLPFALAIFPQKTTVNVSSLEDKFSDLKDKEGNKITTVQFNRGL
ncbi:DEKNAAC101998 [Brettanomyces naardenensis]|uniref:Sidoreflexin n=1 Tax=Brettanomyces naardenensis TaxID=13370 RepID=A0A448YJH1_BRENA|nr:DEKNAAC101998 [Brettanomyces naardenensis]